jgi:hypothetical protein
LVPIARCRTGHGSEQIARWCVWTKPANPQEGEITMRWKALGLIVLLSDATGLSAQDDGWQEFSMEGFHFTVDIPSDFMPVKRFDNYSIEFNSPDGSVLGVWGGDWGRNGVRESDFLSLIDEQIKRGESEGWVFTYKRIKSDWVSYSGIRDDKIRYARAEIICGDEVAFFSMDYDLDKKIEYDPIVTRMVRSMKAKDCEG